MVKTKFRYTVLAAGFLAFCLPMSSAYADENACTVDYTGDTCVASTFQELSSGFGNQNVNKVLLGADVTITGRLDVYGKTEFDLNGFNIDFSVTGSQTIIVNSGGKLTVEGPGTISRSDDVACIKVVGEGGAAELIINDDVKLQGNDKGVQGEYDAIITMNGGTIIANNAGIIAFDNTTVTMNGGLIQATDGFGIAGNGTWDPGAEFYINGGTIESSGVGIYIPQEDGIVNISGGKIIAGSTGVEIRSGVLNVTGGEIISKATEFSIEPNKNGSTTTGAAIAVAQHTTKYPISVNISGGKFVGLRAFNEANPQKNPAEDIAKVNVSITGGVFDGAIASEDLSDFVSGGVFSDEPDEEELIPGFEAELNQAGTGYEIYPKKIDWKLNFLETLYGNGSNAIFIEFNKELIADRKSALNTEEKTDLGGYSLVNGGDLYKVFNIDMVDRDNSKVAVSENDLTVYIEISEEDYKKLSQYDKIYAVYFDDDGNEVERIEAKLVNESDTWYTIEFNTAHLSSYGIVGVGLNAVTAPETGTVTATGASATVAALTTAIAVGLLTSIVSFAYLIRKH